MTPDSPAPPEDVVRRQTDADNDGDVDAFVACYAEDARILRLDDETPVAAGREAIREEYSDPFEAVPDLACEMTEEFAVGPYVACSERVTGTGEPTTALAVYLVREGAIRRLWLAGA